MFELPTVDTTNAIVGQYIPEIKSYKQLLNSDACHSWLCKQSNLIGWSFSVTPMALHIYQFDRLIAAKYNPSKYSGIKTPVKIAVNIHAKCYIGKHEALIGSYNLTAPTIEDLGIVISDKRLLAHLRKEFDSQWKLLA